MKISRLHFLFLSAISFFVFISATDTRWIELGKSATGGGVSNTSGWSLLPSLVLDSSGNPVVAWQDNSSGSFQVFIKKWNPAGGSWIEVGNGSASGGGISGGSRRETSPSLARDSSGNLFMAWINDNEAGFGEIYVKRWDPANGGAWVEVGKGSASAGGISDNKRNSIRPSLAVDSSGHPVVAWHDNTFATQDENYYIYIKRFDGAAWREVGAGSATGEGLSPNHGKTSTLASLALDPAGNPIVAWQDNSSGNFEIYIKRWDGKAWREVGSGSASGGGISCTKGTSKWPSLALDATGAPYVAWHDNSSGNDEIYIKRFNSGNSGAWVEVSAGSASGGGISGNKGNSKFPSLRLDARGNPVVVWYDNTYGGIGEIYIKRWNGSSWTELGRQSASVGGISDDLGDSAFPSLALDLSGNPVIAWGDFSSKWSEIYLKRFSP